MMDDFDNFGVTLKSLDELDTNHYTPRKNDSSKDLKNMTTSKDLALDNDDSDFDNSDLASLLEDDDDDVFAKKVFENAPSNTSTSEAKKSNILKKTTSDEFFESPSKEVVKTSKAETSFDDLGDDALNEFLHSKVSKATSDTTSISLHKQKNKENNLQNEDDNDSLTDLKLGQFSPVKDKKAKPVGKTPDISDDLNTTNVNSKVSGERRKSFLDEFLQNLSPKHKSNKPANPDTFDENLQNNDEIDEDILGAYTPSAAKKNDTVSYDLPKSPKKRGSLSKQVSFGNFSDDFLETDVSKPKTFTSPEIEKREKVILPDFKKGENSAHSRRSEKVNENEDMDWLSYFSPKKTSKPLETKKITSKSSEKIDFVAKNKSIPAMKRQSSADWLGLNDSKMLEDVNENNNKSFDKNEIGDTGTTNLKSVKQLTTSKTMSAPVIRSHQQEISNKVQDEDDFIKHSNQPLATDLSEILKETDRKTKSLSTFSKGSTENKNLDYFPISESYRNSKVSSSKRIISDVLPDDFISDTVSKKNYIPNDSFDKSSRNLHEAHENTLHSLQLMLDDCMKEKNKLLKENEAMKISLEEKFKLSEELHKSEKKMLEDSFKALESSLKQEFEIKLKSLEERLHFVTQEKEKQTKNFEEKFHNLLKEHQSEIQRLKELHNQSINIMKQDHEDALLRLNKLKEQEIEAISSAQTHSKSLQYLSDQLEARANDLASLQNKIEERNQSTLREKQVFLETKEKELKALQSRLQKQFDDGEEEKTRLQQLVLRLESRLQKVAMENEEDHWETQQLKAKLTVQQKYLEEEQKLNQYQIQKEKEKLKLSQDSLLHEQKTVLLQLAQERQQLMQEKNDLQALAKNIKEEEAKWNVKKLKEESSIEAERQFLVEERDKLHFEKEKVKQEFYQLERNQDSLLREKQQLKRDKEALYEQEIDLRRKMSEVDEKAKAASVVQEKGQRELTEALAIKKELEIKMQQHNQQMQILMNKERDILSEKEKLIAEKIEFEQNKNSILCTRCKFSIENPFQVSSTPALNMPNVLPLPNSNGISSQVQQSFVDPNLVIWHITAEKDREFLQEELAFLKSLKEANKRKNSK